MNWLIDIVAILLLLLLFMNGCRRGFLLSLLSVTRVLISLLIAALVGKYLGNWLANTFFRPRLITIPSCAIVTFSLLQFIFRFIIFEVRDRQLDKAEEDGVKFNLFSQISGGTISLAAGFFTMILFFWIASLFLVGFFGSSLPGSTKSKFAGITRRTIYEISYMLSKKPGKESQAAATSRMISNPDKGFKTMENILKADSIQALIWTPSFAEDFLSGDQARLQTNSTVQALLNDDETLNNFRELGVLPPNSKNKDSDDILRIMSDIGLKMDEKLQDEQASICVEQLAKEEMLSPEKIPELVRDQRFHIIIDALLK